MKCCMRVSFWLVLMCPYLYKSDHQIQAYCACSTPALLAVLHRDDRCSLSNLLMCVSSLYWFAIQYIETGC